MKNQVQKQVASKPDKRKIAIAVSAIAIIILAVLIVVFVVKPRLTKPEPTTTTTTTKPTTTEPFVLLSSIKHEFAKREVMGRVESEKLGISCNLVYGTSDDCLGLGAGFHETSSLPGYATPPIIAGHCQTVFKGLQNAAVGDEISLVMPYGTYVYRISKIEVMNKDDFDFGILDEPCKQAIFYTCYPFGKVNYVKTQRMFVYCDYVSGDHIKDDIHIATTENNSSTTAGRATKFN